jgi:hypothetical protein
VWILDAIEYYQQACSSGYGLIVLVLCCGAVCDDALVGLPVGGSFESGALLKSYGHSALAAKIDNLLNSGAAGAARDENAVERMASLQRLSNRMNANQQTHFPMVLRSFGR